MDPRHGETFSPAQKKKVSPVSMTCLPGKPFPFAAPAMEWFSVRQRRRNLSGRRKVSTYLPWTGMADTWKPFSFRKGFPGTAMQKVPRPFLHSRDVGTFWEGERFPRVCHERGDDALCHGRYVETFSLSKRFLRLCCEPREAHVMSEWGRISSPPPWQRRGNLLGTGRGSS